MSSLAYALSDADLLTMPAADPGESAWEKQTRAEPSEWKVVARGRTRGVELVFSYEPPAWAAKTMGDLLELLELPEGWNTYNAQQVEPDVVRQASDVLFGVVEHQVPRPAIVPTAQGGVQIEWHGDADVEIEIRPNGSVGFLVDDDELDFRTCAEAIPAIHRKIRSLFR